MGLACFAISGCVSTEGKIALGVGAVTLAGARAPSNEIEQTYYLGVFDPQEQLPPQLYRLRVHGQASAISATKFASGWVPAHLVDSLSSGSLLSGSENPFNGLQNAALSDPITSGRRLYLFGPEGFREAPKDHRLVVVMGSSPQDFFNAIDSTLGDIADVRAAQKADGLSRELLQALVDLKSEQAAFAEIKVTNGELRASSGREGQ